MKKRSRFLFSSVALSVAACVGILVGNTQTAATSMAYSVEQRLRAQKVAVSDVSLSDGVLSVTVDSEGTGRSTPEDMLAYRAVRDTVRLLKAADTLIIRIIDTLGDTIYDETLNHVLDTPEFGLKIDESAVPAADTEEVLRGALAELGAEIQLIEVSDSEFGGKSVMVELHRKFDVDEVNRTVEVFVALIDALNDKKEVVICQYRLSVSDESEDLLVQLSADLIKRSFSWWQSPRLGVETWTGNTPIIPPSD
ncbi:MAG: hypothetical protein LBD92_04255 [Oscillospiraceae bacterium]|jgi:hypothetical protein|nr:hypothetical protein [Oscillospiraceae bacterium]